MPWPGHGPPNLCGTIDIGEDYMGTVTLWDTDYTKSEPMVSASVSLSESGTGEYGTMTSEGGWFTNIELAHADWIVDPGLADYPDAICISGYYEAKMNSTMTSTCAPGEPIGMI